MSGDLRDRLAEALTHLWEQETGEPLDDLDVFAETRDRYVTALLPVVLAYGDECAEHAVQSVRRAAAGERLRFAAQTLRDAAAEIAADQHVDLDYVPDVLRDRADDLDGGTA